MARDADSALTRRRKIVSLVREQSRCTVNDLARQFDVTTATIRTDLAALEAEGKVVRTYGGAVPASGMPREASPELRGYAAEKRRIAHAALPLVGSEETIVLATGTTVLAFARALARSNVHDLRIITPDLNVALALDARDDFTVIVLGGELSHRQQYSYGDQAELMADAFHAQKCFMSTMGVSLEAGLTAPDVRAAQLDRRLLSMAGEHTLLADASKLGVVALERFADLGQMDNVVMDDSVDDQTAGAIVSLGVNLVLAP